jgi:hypothetical protein
MIGFSLVHLHPEFFLLGVLGLLLVEVWCLAAIVMTIRRRGRLPKRDWIQIAFLGGFILLDVVPTGWWQFIISAVFGPSHP